MARRARWSRDGERSFGSVRQRGSGRWQVRYLGPDGETYNARTEDGRSLTCD
jgi:hypothetical protein